MTDAEKIEALRDELRRLIDSVCAEDVAIIEQLLEDTELSCRRPRSARASLKTAGGAGIRCGQGEGSATTYQTLGHSGR
jgi:hypothetical protein